MFSQFVTQERPSVFPFDLNDEVFGDIRVWSNGDCGGRRRSGGGAGGWGWASEAGQPQQNHMFNNQYFFPQLPITPPFSTSPTSSVSSSIDYNKSLPLKELLSPLTVVPPQQQRVHAVGPFSNDIWSPIGTELKAPMSGARRAIRKAEPVQSAQNSPIYTGWASNNLTPHASPVVPRRVIDSTPKRSDKFDFKKLIDQAKMLKEQYDKRMTCNFCFNNHESEEIYTSHGLKDSLGHISCPILQAYKCPKCHATGEKAHTIKYCPIIQKNAKFNKIRKFAPLQSPVQRQ